MTWDEFTRLFLAHFLPKSVRVNNAWEFESLVQIDQMTMADYNIQFERLSQYAPHLMAIKKLRVQCFVTSLRPYIFKVLAGIDVTYEEVLNKALIIE